MFPVSMTRPRAILCLLLAILLAGGPAAVPSVSPRAETLPKADRILVFKSARTLHLLRNWVVIKSYPIALGPHPLGPKQQRGDGRTPEGFYTIDRHWPESAYHLALHISYPNAEDRARAKAAGGDPGGRILIHGMPEAAGHRDPDRFYRDWTDGCIAVGNTAIEEIFAAVADGIPIEIRP